MNMQEKNYEMNERQLDEIAGGMCIVYYDHQTNSWQKECIDPLKRVRRLSVIAALALKAARK